MVGFKSLSVLSTQTLSLVFCVIGISWEDTLREISSSYCDLGKVIRNLYAFLIEGLSPKYNEIHKNDKQIFILKLLKIDNRLKKFLQLAISQSERRNEYKTYRKCFK